MTAAVAWAVLAPLAGALLSFLCPRRAAPWVATLATAGTLAAVAGVARSVATGGTVRHLAGGWSPPLGIELRADGLAALMLLTVGVVGALASSTALRERSGAGQLASLGLPGWLFAWAALNALILSADVFNLYVTLELTTLAAVALLSAGGTRDALAAALRYLLVALPGSLLYLLGVALLYGAHATLDVTALAQGLVPGRVTWVALGLMTLGLCLKAALFPLHGWLPPAYVAAPPAAAALLSGLLGKAPFYVLLRLWLDLFPAAPGPGIGQLLGALGAAGVIWGSLLALRQRRLRALLAFSSVAQTGYLFLLFSLGTPGAFTGGVYLAISHAASKAALFLAAGELVRARGSDELSGLQGLAHHLPVTFLTLALAGLSLMGLPPGGGFVGKWLLLGAAAERGAWGLFAVILAGGLLAAGYVFRILRHAFLPVPEGASFTPPPRGAELPALALALIALLLGLAPGLPLELLAVGRPW